MSQSPPSKAAPARRGASLFLLANGVSQVAALLRYVVLARILGPEQVGLAATLVLTAAFFDLISDTGSDRFLIQDEHGDTPEVQRLVHLVYIGRGLGIGLCLLIGALPIAAFYRAPALAGGLAVLALSPVILGFTHLDMRRTQRHLDFTNESIGMITGETLGLAATVTAAFLTHNFTAILYGLITRALVIVICSHLTAKRRYEVAFSRPHAARLSKFSGPLMLNGVLMFLATQGDRAIVGRELGFAALGRYSAILMLIYYPGQMVGRYISAMYLPLLARVRDDPAALKRVRDTFGGQNLMLAACMAVGFAAVAPFVVKILYGRRFTETVMVVALIGILQSARFMLLFSTTLSISLGRSASALTFNIIRLAAYPAAYVGLTFVHGLPGLLGGFLFGELLAQALGLTILNRVVGAPLFMGVERAGQYLAGAAGILGVVWGLQGHHLPAAAAFAAGLVGLAALIARREPTAVAATLVLARDMTARLRRRS